MGTPSFVAPATLREHPHPTPVPTGANPDVSILTRVAPTSDRMVLLVELHHSLPRAAAATDWEWVLAVEGAHPGSVPVSVREDPRVRIVQTPRHGYASTMNLALQASTGRYVTFCHQRTRLLEWSVTDRVSAASMLGLDWVAAQSVGSERAMIGHVDAGDVWAAWADPAAELPVHPETLLIHADLLRRVGGWPALIFAEDLGMAVAVTSTAAGFVSTDDTLLHYRRKVSPRQAVLAATSRSAAHERGRLLTS